jgi:hypothetical protein
MAATAAPAPAPPAAPLQPEASECAYQACYCEENVYHLVRTQLAGRNVHVVFLSNPNRTFPIWHMKNAHEPGGVVVWDYHVIAVERREGGELLVWDLDCALGFGIPFEPWATQSLRPQTELREQYRHCFRVASADEFLSGFASDRSHMRNPDGGYQMPPPPKPCIVAASGETHTLPKWWDMVHREPGYGEVHDQRGFLTLFGVEQDG